MLSMVDCEFIPCFREHVRAWLIMSRFMAASKVLGEETIAGAAAGNQQQQRSGESDT